MYVPLAVECYLFDHIYINKTYPIWSSPKSDEKTEFKENTLYAKYKSNFYAKTDYLCAATGRMYVPGWAERRSKEWEKHLSLGLGGHKHKLIQWKQKLMERLQLHNVSLSCPKINHIFKCNSVLDTGRSLPKKISQISIYVSFLLDTVHLPNQCGLGRRMVIVDLGKPPPNCLQVQRGIAQIEGGGGLNACQDGWGT